MEESTKRLFRSSKDRVIAGVCGGLGEYFNIDPIIFRILFLVLIFGGGFGVLLYIILAIAIPQESGEHENNGKFGERVNELADEMRHQHGWLSGSRNIVGLVVVLLGIFLLLSQILPFHWFSWNFFWPVIVILIGIYILMRKGNK